VEFYLNSPRNQLGSLHWPADVRLIRKDDEQPEMTSQTPSDVYEYATLSDLCGKGIVAEARQGRFPGGGLRVIV
jgi:hypothetical protein